MKMDSKELKKILKRERIPKDLYSLKGGLPNESYCLEKNADKWEVYYSERGIRSDLKVFDTEEEACKHLYKRVKRCC